MRASRRSFILRGLCASPLCCALAAAWARVLPTNLMPLVSAGYRPTEPDERGLWRRCDALERELATSKLLLDDSALKSYIGGVMQRLLGDQAAQLRRYPVRSPEFNAAMAPNGMMIVQTGLLVRMRNEAQLAAVLGHERVGHPGCDRGHIDWREFQHGDTRRTDGNQWIASQRARLDDRSGTRLVGGSRGQARQLRPAAVSRTRPVGEGGISEVNCKNPRRGGQHQTQNEL